MDSKHRSVRGLAVGTGASALLLGIAAAPPAALAQDGAGRYGQAGAPVALHEGSCVSPAPAPTTSTRIWA